jgi:membrane associated rhomboid family serine protease
VRLYGSRTRATKEVIGRRTPNTAPFKEPNERNPRTGAVRAWDAMTELPDRRSLEHDHERDGATSQEEPDVEYCYGHPDTPTRLHCTRCDRPICGRCAVPASVGQHCVWCVAEDRKKAPKVRSTLAAASPVVMALIAVNVAVWLAQSALVFANGLTELDFLTREFSMRPLPIADGEWWRLITPMFLHAPFTGALFSLLHIGFNMYILRSFGPNAEEAFGSVSFLGMYLLAGLMGSASSYAFNSADTLGVGASGAVFGVIGILIVYLRRRRTRAFVNHYVRMLMMFVGLNLMLGFIVVRIDNLAHIGGLAAGLVLGYGLDAGDAPISAARRILTFTVVAGAALALVVYRTAALT